MPKRWVFPSATGPTVVRHAVRGQDVVQGHQAVEEDTHRDRGRDCQSKMSKRHRANTQHHSSVSVFLILCSVLFFLFEGITLPAA